MNGRHESTAKLWWRASGSSFTAFVIARLAMRPRVNAETALV
jgi:hypothetical protein